MSPMTVHEIQDSLETLPGWRLEGAWLARDVGFANFQTAWAFMGEIALLAEEQDHHPNWYNVYNRVQIRLSSHDAGGITARDIRLANAINVALTKRTYRDLDPSEIIPLPL